MRHLDLFSGIGGFALAVDCIWHEEENEHIFVEWDPFCTAVLKKHWPEAEYHKDIRAFIAGVCDKERSTIDILTGGFPCQPFSHAGRRKGTDDDRYLWPAMFEAISLFRPRWVIAENVSGIASWNEGVVFETVCDDMESKGYEVQPFRIPACAVGAPHRRDRWWFVGHAKHDGFNGTKNFESNLARSINNSEGQNKLRQSQRTNSIRKTAPNSIIERLQRTRKTRARQYGQSDRARSNQRPDWNQDWTKVATSLCTMDDGVSNGLVRPKGWRNAALKAAGNSIVPQVAEEIMIAIKEYEGAFEHVI